MDSVTPPAVARLQTWLLISADHTATPLADVEASVVLPVVGQKLHVERILQDDFAKCRAVEVAEPEKGVGDGPRDTAGAQSTECALCRLLQDEEAFLGYLVGEVRPPKNDTLSNWREQLADWKAYDFVWVSGCMLGGHCGQRR
ncbi:unnamed protein product [Vitrella brassicaformis CCMP3155]|uniref:Uncharacterized protein n=1 Tax=Vitrella brassicaformis (strain CCMP3155) TaxID=1169540 RepID=A0A0G4ESF1_VITBC|nr:unnamed protein product [Vitrella brassicaformis CCMP3155]|eukprot:CEM00611.1 unnamed protein product [Vitrella brassicaformis CCMP3155]